MESILEQQRRYHHTIESNMQQMVEEYNTKKLTEKDKILADNRMKNLLKQRSNATTRLQELYEDRDNQRKAEILAISGPDQFMEFYARLNEIKEFHKEYALKTRVPFSIDLDDPAKVYSNPEEMDSFVSFNDEEGNGTYLDLNECHSQFLNIPGIEKVDYITYLMTFDHMFDIPKDRKKIEYKKYLNSLVGYLRDYITRIRPLFDLEAELEKVEHSFQKQWAIGTFPGWPKEIPSVLASTGAYVDLSSFSSWEELASLGLDRLKFGLKALGLKCGGTMEERAQRLFSTRGKTNFDAALMPKKISARANTRKMINQKTIAALEAVVYWCAEYLSKQRSATKENIQRKQARTAAEWKKSENEASDDDNNDEEEVDNVPYNPKHLPLALDGKPIPLWLYKLHGLHESYNCEICGNFAYKGPKAFQRHFAEWRHHHGLRCLGIPNTAHFANVTGIENAITLWEKVKAQNKSELWIPDQQEEFEDSQGNTMNRKTYEDLKRQGLL